MLNIILKKFKKHSSEKSEILKKKDKLIKNKLDIELKQKLQATV